MARGDHVKVRRNGYWHHGVDLGAEGIAHFVKDTKAGVASKTKGTIGITGQDVFSEGGEIVIVPHETRLPAEAAVERARARVGEDGYALWSNICEHFASDCVTGKGKSRQVKSGIKGVGGLSLCVFGLRLLAAGGAAPVIAVASGAVLVFSALRDE